MSAKVYKLDSVRSVYSNKECMVHMLCHYSYLVISIIFSHSL